MHRLVFVAALGFGLAVLAGPSRAFAFTGERVQAYVPFAFHVDGAKLPPGSYTVEQLDILEPNVLRIMSRDGRQEAIFLTDNSTARSVHMPELVFDRYGQQRFLHAIWLPDDTGAVVQAQRTEVRAAEAYALARARTAESTRKGR